MSICFVLRLPGRLLCTAILTELDSSRHDVTFYCLVSLLSAQISQTESEMKEGQREREEKQEEAETELHGFRLVNNVRLLM